MGKRQPEDTDETEAFTLLAARLAACGLAYRIHEHEPARTLADARERLSFDVTRIVKTVAFGLRSGGLILAALRAVNRADYARLAALAGVNRRDLAALSPEAVSARLGVEPGGVSPLSPAGEALRFVDEDVLGIAPTLYCGLGRPDRTLEIAPRDLLALTGARTGRFSR